MMLPALPHDGKYPVGCEALAVRPLCIFAAGRHKFDVVAWPVYSADEVKAHAFRELPLHDNGWCFATARITQTGADPVGDIIWTLERG